MNYSNPDIPEGINTSREHPLKEFAILGGGIIGGIMLIVLVMSLLAETLAPHIPFSLEQQIASRFIEPGDKDSEIQAYLDTLAEEISLHMDLPADMDITLHYVDEDIQNAYATLGGHIFIYRGLLTLMPHENALSMVIAHEIAHVQHRHPVVAMGRGVVIGLFLATITGLTGDRMTGSIIGNAGALTVLGFSRQQERQADRTALATVQKYYGHVAGASDLFRALMRVHETGSLAMPQFLSTHPLGIERIEAIENMALQNNWSSRAPTTALKYGINPAQSADTGID